MERNVGESNWRKTNKSKNDWKQKKQQLKEWELNLIKYNKIKQLGIKLKIKPNYKQSV
jgi:hypothetical protein